jgi:hypothetical protein
MPVLMSCSSLIALVGWLAPQQMPIDIHSLLWYSLPLAGLWLGLLGLAGLWLRTKALWLLIGAPLALYWPIWLLLNGIPSCYWNRTCV